LIRRSLAVTVASAVACACGPALARAKQSSAKTLTVCKHGCRYTTIQAAVNASGCNATINVKPGKYIEGVIVQGHRHDGLRIVGVGKKPTSVLIEGKNAHGPEGAAQHGVFGENVNNLDLENMKAEHFPSNGFFINGCKGYLMKNLVAGFNRSYGEPASSGVMEHNLIYWNKFDYYRPSSPVRTVSSGVGADSANYPIGAGVILFGTTGWTVKDNSIFGNFLWGAAAFSDPTNDTGKAENNANRFIDNKMGAKFNDANGVDFYNDGSGKGTCFEGNYAGSTVDTSATDPSSQLYPSCPANTGTGTINGDPTQFAKLAAIVLAQPATKQENFWHVHKHPARAGRTPFEG
jgi:hypothetical protein